MILQTDRHKMNPPSFWDKALWKRMIEKPEKERLIIAGALIAAEIDRIQYVEKAELMVDNEAFKTFARLHPVEAFDLNKEQFCDFMRDEGRDLTNLQIESLITESR